MIAAIASLFRSRKFLLVLVGTVVAIGAKLGFDVDPEIVALVVALFGSAILGIAYEDGQAKRLAPPPATPPTPSMRSIEVVDPDEYNRRFGTLPVPPGIVVTGSIGGDDTPRMKREKALRLVEEAGTTVKPEDKR